MTHAKSENNNNNNKNEKKSVEKVFWLEPKINYWALLMFKLNTEMVYKGKQCPFIFAIRMCVPMKHDCGIPVSSIHRIVCENEMRDHHNYCFFFIIIIFLFFFPFIEGIVSKLNDIYRVHKTNKWMGWWCSWWCRKIRRGGFQLQII